MEDSHEGALKAIEEIFGDRLKRTTRENTGDASGGALASAFPTSAEEVARLADVTRRHSVPLAALGAETFPETPEKEGRILVRFDFMRGHRLRLRGRGLTVYPTSAPRATVGGWLCMRRLCKSR